LALLAGVAVVPEDVVVVVLDVFVLLFGFSVSPQPTIMPKPKSKTIATIFFIFPTSNQECINFSSPEPFRRPILDPRL